MLSSTAATAFHPRQRVVGQQRQKEERDVLLPKSGPNTVLVRMLDMARFGVPKNDLLGAEEITTSSSLCLAKTCLSFLVSNSLLEEENVVLYPLFGSGSSRAMLFTTRQGFCFLRSYLDLAHLAGALGEPNYV
jgi:hypothetical protein